MLDEPAPDKTEGNARSGYRWYALALMIVIYTLYNVDRNLVPALAESIKLEFGLSDTQLGTLSGLVYAIAFSLTGIPVGMLVDRVNRSRLIAALLAIWSGATVLGGLVTSFVSLVVARTAVASAESGASPTCMSLITDFFGSHQRATAIGLFYLSTSIGLAIGFSMAGVVAAHFGWRAAFFVGGVPGLVLSLIVLLTLREPDRGAFDGPFADTPSLGLSESMRLIWNEPALRNLSAAGVALIVGQSGISSFLVPFFIRYHEISIDQTGLLVAFILGGGTAIGTTFGGILADRISAHSAAAACRFVAITSFACIPFAVFGLLAPTPLVTVGSLFTYCCLVNCFYGPTFATYLSGAPVSVRGTAGAILIVLMNLVGYGFGPQVTGILSDLYRLAGIENHLNWAMISATLFFLAGVMLYIRTAGAISGRPEAPS